MVLYLAFIFKLLTKRLRNLQIGVDKRVGKVSIIFSSLKVSCMDNKHNDRCTLLLLMLIVSS